MRPRGIALPCFFWALIPTGLAVADSKLESFAQALDTLRRDNNVPGISAAIVHDQALAWAGGFGYADRENQIPATENTLYRIASLSKPLAATLLMQLVEAGKLELDAPMKDFTIHAWFEPGSWSGAHFPQRYEDNPIRVRHVLAHTSEGIPGSAYNYNGNIFADLTWVVEDVLKQSYPDVLRERILDPAGMTSTSPGQLAPPYPDVAKAYKWEGGTIVESTYPGMGIPVGFDTNPWNLNPVYRLPEASTAARKRLLGDAYTTLYSASAASGVVTSVTDLARFDIALDQNSLVSAASKEQMWAAATTPDGGTLPYGLGWFVETQREQRLVWHYGWFPPVISALYVKVPEKGVSFILLANTDQLSAGYAWSTLGVQASPYARLFLEHFVFEPSSAAERD